MDLPEAISAAHDAADHIGSTNAGASNALSSVRDSFTALESAIETAQHAIELLAALKTFCGDTLKGVMAGSLLSQVSTDKDKLSQCIGMARSCGALLEELLPSLAAMETEADALAAQMNS